MPAVPALEHLLRHRLTGRPAHRAVASGAAGATFIEFAEEGGRVVAGDGAMAWSTGQPVSEKVLEREHVGQVGTRHDRAARPGPRPCW